MQSFHMLFHLLLTTTLTPTQWNTSQIVPIPKKSSTFTPSSSRPISLTPCLRRIFESLLLQYIYSDQALNEFSPFQAGFRPGYNTMTQLWLSQASTHFPTDPRLIHIFLDLEKAYDRVPIPRLLDKLMLRKTPSPLIQLVDSLFSHCHSQLIVNKAVGPIFRRSVGLFQGSILSPWLFNVYIDDLALKIARIDPHPIIPPCLLFADDIKLQPSSVSVAKRMLAIVTTWSVHNGIKINAAKSGVISNTTTASLHLSINNQPLPLVQQYEYLGLPFHAKGIDFPLYVHNLARRTEILFFASTRNSRGWSPFIRLILFKTFLRPTYEYAFPLLFGSQVSLTPLIKLQDMICNWLVNGHRSPVIAHVLTGLSPIPLRIHELTMRFQFKLRTTHPQNPIRSLVTSLRSLPTSSTPTPSSRKRLLLPLITPIPMYNTYLAKSNASPPWLPLTITEFIQSHKLEHFLSLSHTLPKNVLPMARDSSLVDISIRVRTPPIRSYALRWRMNRLLANYRCLCGAWLNRGHLDTCFQLNEHPLYTELCSKASFPQPKPTNHYNLIDHALNTGSLSSFLQLLHFVTRSDDFIFDPP
jgi:Reverse transcriptase (RNA-dependent DNA polymerase)